jgi:hypothetical protein
MRLEAMPNSHLRCKGCEKYFKRETLIPVNGGKFHSIECMTRWGYENRQKGYDKLKQAKKKENAKKKKAFYDSDLKTRKKAAKLACHKYIKLRDKGLPCICCNRALDGKIDAGHYLESGNNPKIRYDEDNIHSQSVYCNQYQGGNSDDYRGNLIKKIGLKRVERLESMKGGSVKRTPQDYKEIEDYYKSKIKLL